MLDLADVARLAAGLVGEGGVLAVEREGAGWDHVAWRVDTPEGPWIVRAATDGTPGQLAADARREVAVMQLVRRRLGGGWAADAVVLDAELGCIAHRRVPGVALQELLAAGTVEPGVLAAIARRLGELVREIGGLDPAAVGEPVATDDGLDAWLDEAPSHVAVIGDLLTPARRTAVDELLAAPLPAPPAPAELVLVHNDLGAEHVLVDPASGSITGIIDWSDAAVGDPAGEVGRLLRDLGEVHLPLVLDGVGPAEREALTARAWCYARLLVLEDLAHAVQRRPDLVAFELANLDRLFERRLARSEHSARSAVSRLRLAPPGLRPNAST